MLRREECLFRGLLDMDTDGEARLLKIERND
jgi:hypothetical protein